MKQFKKLKTIILRKEMPEDTLNSTKRKTNHDDCKFRITVSSGWKWVGYEGPCAWLYFF